MNIKKNFPHSIREISHTELTMSDGTRLAARIWMPEDAVTNPVPGILEYIPYRKNDMTAVRDSVMHPYFAGHGYASIRVDIRGSGDSEGVLTDEYLEQELSDGEEILQWIANQPWCTGKVGMYGKSWGGFNGLQLAARRPPELQAVVTVSSTDDRYSDDIHHMGGCLLGDNLSWASTMFAYNSLPPDPRNVGQDRWKDMWLERLEGSGLWLEKWLQHQYQDEYWLHGSVCRNYQAIQCPVFAISGWADGYSNTVFRMVENLDVPTKGLIGPWSHKFPHSGTPGPAIGFLQECLRWWDQWLKGIDTGVAEEPRLRVWMQDSIPPSTSYEERPGRWVAEEQWTSEHIQTEAFPLASGLRLLSPGTPSDDSTLTIQSPLSVGLFAGKWCSYQATPDLPHDQREEDGGSLIFESAPLQDPMEIMGTPCAKLTISSNKEVAMIAVRLSDIAPDDKATRVTYGLLNLTHRDGSMNPKPLEPNKQYNVRVDLNGIAQHFPRGHRFRLSISTSYWPLAWAPPEPVRLKIHTKNSALILPIRPPRKQDRQLHLFKEAEGAPPLRTSVVKPTEHNWFVKRNLASGESALEVVKDDGIQRLVRADLEITKRTWERYSFCYDDFESVRGETNWERGFKRDKWNIHTRGRTVLTSDASHFYIHAELDAFEKDKRIFSKNWIRKIRRNMV